MSTYYIKKGRRYVPVAEERHYDTLPFGTHLVSVKAGVTSWKYHVDVDNAGVLQAMLTAKEAMAQALVKANAAAPKKQNVPKHLEAKYKAAWKAWSDIIGEDMPLVFEGLSPIEIVEAGIKALQEEMAKQKPQEEDLVDPNAGTPIKWVEGHGWVKDPKDGSPITKTTTTLSADNARRFLDIIEQDEPNEALKKAAKKHGGG